MTTVSYGILIVVVAVVAAVADLVLAQRLILYVIAVIAVLDYPFSGGVSVQPDVFELVLRVIEGDNEP